MPWHGSYPTEDLKSLTLFMNTILLQDSGLHMQGELNLCQIDQSGLRWNLASKFCHLSSAEQQEGLECRGSEEVLR